MKKEKVTVIVPAAGLGKRFGKSGTKQFQTLGGKPLIVWSLEVFESINSIIEVIPVLKKADMGKMLDFIAEYRLTKIKKIAPGGKERQDSVYSGLKLTDEATGIVLIHDGARPLIEKSIVEKSISEVKNCDGVIVAVPVKDTIKEGRSSGKEIFIKKTLQRDVLWAVQTPQVFKYAFLMKAYEKSMAEGFYSTDDSAIVEKYGGRVKVITGSYTNIKVTTPEDLNIAEMLFKKAASF